MVIAILLVILLFMAGLINTYFFKFPTKKFYVWLQSFFFGDSLVVSTIDSAPVPPVLSKEKTPPAHRKEELKRVFATFDKNGDGFITKLELRESLKNLRLFVTEKEAEEMVVKVDTNGDGLIDLDEFCILCEGTLMDGDEGGEDDRGEGEGEGGGEEEELKEAFDVFDKDGDGLISVEELGLVLCSLGLKEGKKMEDCKEMIKRVDVDGDGMVNFDEFKRMMKRGGGLFSVS